MNFFHVFEQGNAVLMATFLLLISMSFVSWYLIFWKAWNVYKERNYLNQFKKHYMIRPDWPRHAVITETRGGVQLLIREANKTQAVLGQYEKDQRKEIMGIHLSQSLDMIRSWLDKGLTMLASIGSSAPFIGLFGTVWGIYGALTRIAAEGNASLNVVAGPMGEALVATAIGLFAAIPAVLAYNAFVRINRLLVQDLRHIAEHLTIYLSEESTLKEKESDVVQLVQK